MFSPAHNTVVFLQGAWICYCLSKFISLSQWLHRPWISSSEICNTLTYQSCFLYGVFPVLEFCLHHLLLTLLDVVPSAFAAPHLCQPFHVDASWQWMAFLVLSPTPNSPTSHQFSLNPEICELLLQKDCYLFCNWAHGPGKGLVLTLMAICSPKTLAQAVEKQLHFYQLLIEACIHRSHIGLSLR